MTSEALPFRPYARLLTMLGDQLIKNERIALVELIKNAYDADADRVEVRFEGFRDDMTHDENSRIVVRDDGAGMSIDRVRTGWMNPAAPQKLLDKRRGTGRTPGKKRVVQGEKGIGRFAILKLGRVIKVTTRQPDAAFETILTYDFSRFDDDFVSENDEPKEIFLDQITVDCRQARPEKLRGAEHGTVIEIRDLKGVWNDAIIRDLCRDVSNLTDPVSRLTRREARDRLEIAIACNGRPRGVAADEIESLKTLIEDKAVLDVRGGFRSSEDAFSFRIGDVPQDVGLRDSGITGLWLWRQRFGRADDRAGTQTRKLFPAETEYACGDFAFQFYVFDFARGIDGRYMLTQGDKNRLKDHRIYLYRDEVRVYPYGDPDDDWLKIDVTRGTGRAGDFFSNDQLIGWIDITQKGNPKLRDKTNREGLIETGGAAEDLIFLVQLFLSYVKQYPFARYQQKQRQRDAARTARDAAVARRLADLQEDLSRSGQATQARKVAKVTAAYERERAHLSHRAETAEDLAGVGLSVEMASHDIMLLMNRAQDVARQLARAARPAGGEVQEQADMLVGVLQQIADGMKDIQVLFKSSRRRRKVLKVEPLLDRIHQIYRTWMDQRQVRYRKVTVGKSPLTASTTDGVIMQVLINLFDNACYWLESVEAETRQICVTVDADHGELVFSDSGPGIDADDLPYIFEPFYSGKGQEGRGLGLYIARQLLERHGYRIETADEQRRVLSGANFVVSLVKEDA